MKEIWHRQREGFSELLEKYKDHELSPAAESYERILEKSEMQGSFYYFIKEENVNVGVIRIIDNHDGIRKRISPLWIMPGYRGRGYAQAAIREAENIHGAHCWSLDTILQGPYMANLGSGKMGFSAIEDGQTMYLPDTEDEL